MKTKYGIVVAFLLLLMCSCNNVKSTEIQNGWLYGGEFEEVGNSIQQTVDGGYIATGLTRSYGVERECHEAYDEDDEKYVYCPSDAWLLKIGTNGSLEWEKTFGDQFNDNGISVLQTDDRGFIVLSQSDSRNINVLKTDELGNLEWENSYKKDWVSYCLVQTDDNGYAITGTIKHFYDPYVILIKLGPNGDSEWERTFDNKGSLDYARGVEQTQDGGYLIIGKTNAYGTDTFYYQRIEPDVWLIKTNPDGIVEWEKSYGGIAEEYGMLAHQDEEDSYFVIAITGSYGNSGGSPSGYRGDIWILKLDSDGNKIWDTVFGDIHSDMTTAICHTDDNGYLLTGYSIAPNNSEPFRRWLIKIDSKGAQKWKRFLDPSIEVNSVDQKSDGGYVFTGTFDHQLWVGVADSEGMF